MHWTNIGLILVAGLDVGMALLIWLRNPRHKINRSLATAIFFLGLWAFGSGMLRESLTPLQAIFWTRFLNISTILLMIPFLAFTVYFPYQTYALSKLAKVIISLSAIIMLWILFAPNLWFLRESLFISPPNSNFKVSYGYYIFLIYILFYLSWSYLNLIYKYQGSAGFTQIQLRFILIGTGIISFFGTLFGGITPLFFDLKYFWIGPYFALPMIVCLVYFCFYYRPK